MAHSLTAEDTAFYRLAILDVGIDFLFYGMQIAIFLAVIAASIRGGTRPRCVIILTTSVFLSSTLEVVLGFMFIFAQIPRSDGADATLRLLGLNVPAQLFIIFNFLASDAVVVWRAWILWPQSRVAKGILGSCMAGSTLSVVFNFVWQTVHWKEEQTPAFTLTIWLPLLLTNVVATGLVALQVWYYRRDIQRTLGQWRKTTRVEKVLILLMDSGLVYCLILGTSLAVTFKVVKYGDPAYHITLNIATSAYHSIAGIYPTFIAVVVAVQRSTASSLLLSTQVSRPMQFAGAAVIDGMPQRSDSRRSTSRSNASSLSQRVSVGDLPHDEGRSAASDDSRTDE